MSTDANTETIGLASVGTAILSPSAAIDRAILMRQVTYKKGGQKMSNLDRVLSAGANKPQRRERIAKSYKLDASIVVAFKEACDNLSMTQASILQALMQDFIDKIESEK